MWDLLASYGSPLAYGRAVHVVLVILIGCLHACMATHAELQIFCAGLARMASLTKYICETLTSIGYNFHMSIS